MEVLRPRPTVGDRRINPRAAASDPTSGRRVITPRHRRPAQSIATGSVGAVSRKATLDGTAWLVVRPASGTWHLASFATAGPNNGSRHELQATTVSSAHPRRLASADAHDSSFKVIVEDVFVRLVRQLCVGDTRTPQMLVQRNTGPQGSSIRWGGQQERRCWPSSCTTLLTRISERS